MTVRCNLIIDSCCDLPFSVVDRPGVDLLQFPYITSKGELFDDLYQSRSPKDFYESLRKGETPQTAQVPMPQLIDAFTRAIESGVPTVYLGFSSQLSGNFNTASLLIDQLKEEHPEAELYAVDTKLASVAEAVLVYEALRLRDEGMDAKALVSWAQEARYFVNSYFMLDDLDALKRGGRIPASIAYAGAKLDVKPILTFDLEGKLSLSSVARGRKKGMKIMAENYLKHRDLDQPQNCVALGDADCYKDLERLKEIISKQDESVLFLETQVGPVIGSHTGPGMLALVFWGKDRREDLSVADRIAKKVKSSQE